VLSEIKKEYSKKIPKKITPQRLKNIALYYLKRFETSEYNLRSVLKRRIDDYAYWNKEFDKVKAYQWLDELVEDFVRLGYVDDERFAEMRIRSYLSAGKSPRYILSKLKEKGIDEDLVCNLLNVQEFDPVESALKLAKKKKIGPYCDDDNLRKQRRNKDMGILIRAGFDYDVVLKVLEWHDE
jgi:regulatory protein